MRTTAWLAGAVVLVLAAPVSAYVSRAGDVVAVAEPVGDDLYAVGGTVTVSGPVHGDVVAAGGTVAVDSVISGAALLFGGSVRVFGRVARTVRAAGGTVTVAGPVQADAVLAGGVVTVARGARVARDLAAVGGTVEVHGEVGRRARVGGRTVTIGGSVHGDLEVDADSVVVLPTARVAGTLRYRSPRAADIQPGAVVGRVVREPTPTRGSQPARAGFPWFRVLEALWLLVVGFLAVALLPGVSARVTEEVRRVGRSLLTGFVLLVTVPVASVVLVVTVVGVPVGLMVLALYAVSVYSGQVFAARGLGEAVLARLGRHSTSPYTSTALGTLALAVLFALPWVGWVVRLAAALVGLGGLWLGVYSTARRPENPTDALGHR